LSFSRCSTMIEGEKRPCAEKSTMIVFLAVMRSMGTYVVVFSMEFPHRSRKENSRRKEENSRRWMIEIWKQSKLFVTIPVKLVLPHNWWIHPAACTAAHHETWSKPGNICRHSFHNCYHDSWFRSMVRRWTRSSLMLTSRSCWS
jgi:hypothetical protein